MKIQTKIVLVILPVLAVSIILVGSSSYFLASSGINRLARDFLGFKLDELEKYAYSQYQLLLDNQLHESAEYIQASQGSVEVYALSIIRSETELIAAIDKNAEIQFSTSTFTLNKNERMKLQELYSTRPLDLIELEIEGQTRIAKAFYFPPFEWLILLTESRQTFYQDINRITSRTLILLTAALFSVFIVLLFVSKRITKPLARVVDAMKEIISSNDLNKSVPVEYQDETGQLAHTFNIMTDELNKAYKEIIRFARNAAIAEHKEKKVRHIFQKYVPQELIDRFFANPESMLVGEDRVVSILFSDIRSFTSISERMQPGELVSQLNAYFSLMVDIITGHGGIIDKYIGDAIMAIFGAPVQHEDDHIQSVKAALKMADAVNDFNTEQQKKGQPEFLTGIGVSYGIVTVGNIGADKKMDYTVIGDMVNLASRLEGLTKEYSQAVIIADNLEEQIRGKLPTRLLDTVAVKGKKKGTQIYTVALSLDEKTQKAWDIHHAAMTHYYKQEWDFAENAFHQVRNLLPGDPIADEMLLRCKEYKIHPPGNDWSGVKIMKTK